MFQRIEHTPAFSDGCSWIETYESISGWRAVVYWMNQIIEPYEVHPHACATEAEAQELAYWWAFEKNLPFLLPGFIEPKSL